MEKEEYLKRSEFLKASYEKRLKTLEESYAYDKSPIKVGDTIESIYGFKIKVKSFKGGVKTHAVECYYFYTGNVIGADGNITVVEEKVFSSQVK